jgi:HD-GYP domain-containing protein (c-di-GMP phosphodiesterase class II)
MALVNMSQVKHGDRLAQDVLTKRNSLLFTKGTTISQRELEILSAFLIHKVDIEVNSADQTNKQPIESNPVDSNMELLDLYKEYDELFMLIKRVFTLASTGGSLPILDIRNRIEALLAHIDAYNILFFKPPKYVPKDYLFHHSVRVGMTSYTLAKWQGFQQKDLIPIMLAGLMHDIGNAKIDDSLLNKSGPLTAAEFVEVRSHTLYGYELLKKVAGFNEGTKLVSLQHHEREDGSGYPMGITGDKIHPYSKIVAIADIYHAMSASRLYRNAVSPYLVLEELVQYSFGKLDPAIVRNFVDKVTQFHVGRIVKLSDNRIGEIIFSQREQPTRPWVNVNGVIINLTTQRNLHIQDIIE